MKAPPIVILADPPWDYEGVIRPRDSVELRYRTMSDAELGDLPVARLCGATVERGEAGPGELAEIPAGARLELDQRARKVRWSLIRGGGPALLFLWTTAPKLDIGLATLERWGFAFRSCGVWDKRSDDPLEALISNPLGTLSALATGRERVADGWRIGVQRDPGRWLPRLLRRWSRFSALGHYARVDHELILIGRRGAARTPDKTRRRSSVLQAARREHSRKPEEWRAWIAGEYGAHHGYRLAELFARDLADGDWRGTGAELDGRDIAEVLAAPDPWEELARPGDRFSYSCSCGLHGEGVPASTGAFWHHDAARREVSACKRGAEVGPMVELHGKTRCGCEACDRARCKGQLRVELDGREPRSAWEAAARAARRTA